MEKNDLHLNTIYKIDEKDYDKLDSIFVNKIIPDTHKTLQEKFKFILKYNYHLITTSSSKIWTYEEYKNKNIRETFPEINTTDISNIKKYIEDYNASNQNEIPYILDKDKHLTKEIKLKISDLYSHFTKYNKRNFLNECDELVSLKIYDYYQKPKENNYLDLVKNIIDLKPIQKINVLSIVNSLESHIFLENLSIEKKEKISIKVINHCHLSYIPSVFFILAKYRVKGSSNYKDYIFYLEPETNHSVIGFVDNEFSKGFYKLLLKRFDLQFENNENVDFIENLKAQDFDESLKIIFDEMSELLEKKRLDYSDLEDKINKLTRKVLELKIQYPKMNYSYSLLENMVNSICLTKEIENAQFNNEVLTNTIKTLKYAYDNKVYLRMKNILFGIVAKESSKKETFDIFKLRSSIYINKLGKSKKALIDLFPSLKWDIEDNIINSFGEIKFDEFKLDELLNLVEFDSSNLSFIEKQNFYENRILKDFIYTGKVIKLK